MKKNCLFKILLFLPLFLFGFSLSPLKTGDIVFAKYNDYFDYGITAFLNSKYSHTLIKTPRGLFSFTIMYIGDRGTIYIDDNLQKDKEKILVLRPIMTKEQYKVYKRCVIDYSNILENKVFKGEILFDWQFRNYKNSFVCSTFIFHILKECLPDYKKYFLIKNPDRIHYKNKKPIIYFDNALNKKMFKIIYQK